MLSTDASHSAGLLEWIGDLPEWGHGLYSAAEWRAWAGEQQAGDGDRLWHYWTSARGEERGPAATTDNVRGGRRRIWLRSEWAAWVHGLPEGGWGLYTQA